LDTILVKVGFFGLRGESDGFGVGNLLGKLFLVGKLGFVFAGLRVCDAYTYVLGIKLAVGWEACCFFVFCND
jgi:hypothetical protein